MLGLKLLLYWTIAWYDILLHFLGGAWVALGFVWLLFYSGFIERVPAIVARYRIWWTLGAVVLVGVIWEIYEYVFGLTAAYGYALDTTLDLVMDMVGAGAVLLVIPRFRRYETNG